MSMSSSFVLLSRCGPPRRAVARAASASSPSSSAPISTSPDEAARGKSSAERVKAAATKKTHQATPTKPTMRAARSLVGKGEKRKELKEKERQKTSLPAFARLCPSLDWLAQLTDSMNKPINKQQPVPCPPQHQRPPAAERAAAAAAAASEGPKRQRRRRTRAGSSSRRSRPSLLLLLRPLLLPLLPPPLPKNPSPT